MKVLSPKFLTATLGGVAAAAIIGSPLANAAVTASNQNAAPLASQTQTASAQLASFNASSLPDYFIQRCSGGPTRSAPGGGSNAPRHCEWYHYCGADIPAEKQNLPVVAPPTRFIEMCP